MRLVIVGNGMVGQRLVDAVRARDTAGRWQVTVLGEEPHPAYDRVAMTSYLAGRSAAELSVVPAGCYDAETVVLHLREAAVAIDREARSVTGASGATYPYDALVLATGSAPFVPPLPGADLPGCFVYRTLDDLDAIRRCVASARTGIVIGGGLLGLEAAGALHGMGLGTHVVEMAPRLMPVQVDEAGGHVLRRHIEALDVAVHTGVRTERIEPAGRGIRLVAAEGLEGGVLEADLLVFSAGVRPRDALARDAGLACGPRGGVLVDRTCRTDDVAIYAVGECAAVEGVAYGLVAPGYAMAEVVADRLLGGEAVFPGADLSTKLKLLGVDVASFGDAHGRTPGALELVYSDQIAGVYSKLVVTDDARVLLGGILVGDATAYATLRPLVGAELGCPPERLLLPAGVGGESARGGTAGGTAGLLPEAAEVCTCHAVTKAGVVAAIRTEKLADVGAVKACTKAGTGCGSCVPLLQKLLAECGVAPSRALCEHFGCSRAELFDIVRVTGIRTFSGLVAGHGRGRGCDICKPVVASILASLGAGHVLAGEAAALQDTNDHFLANMQKDGTYSIVPRVPGGEITPEKLIVIGEVARDFGLYTKITGGQRIDMFGARVDQLPAIWRRLVDAGMESGHAYGKALRTVKSCVGQTWCRYGVQDSTTLAIELELRYRGLRAPHKIKGGVSGCARECAEARGKDFGIIATEVGWNLYLGGNGGFRPRHAELFAQDLDTATLVRTLDRFLMYYVRTADRLQRTASWIEALDGGLEQLRRVIVDDALGICDDLDAAMAAHVASYSDEWADTLDDPEKVRRFVSFVNAPGAEDPGVARVSERGQPRPARPDERALIAGPVLEVR
jgi:nitrite reductase (NADH) large subunit